MNVLLWILQILLALWNIVGGLYTLTNYEQLRSVSASELPAAVWIVICVLQVVFALGLVLPPLLKMPSKYISISAAYLALNSLAGCVLFTQYAGFPGALWGVIPALIAGFIAYRRRG